MIVAGLRIRSRYGAAVKTDDEERGGVSGQASAD